MKKSVSVDLRLLPDRLLVPLDLLLVPTLARAWPPFLETNLVVAVVEISVARVGPPTEAEFESSPPVLSSDSVVPVVLE